jgi:Family of unknown function (DUF6525)
MSKNASATKHARDYDLQTRMRVFDSFPPVLRRALANGARDWSVRQCHVMLTGGSAREGIKPHTADEIAALIALNDERRMKT